MTAPRLLVLVLVLVLLVLVRVCAASCPAQPDDAPLVHGGDLADAARGGDERAAVGAFLPEFSPFDFGIDGSPSSTPWGAPGLEILPADHFLGAPPFMELIISLPPSADPRLAYGATLRNSLIRYMESLGGHVVQIWAHTPTIH